MNKIKHIDIETSIDSGIDWSEDDQLAFAREVERTITHLFEGVSVCCQVTDCLKTRSIITYPDGKDRDDTNLQKEIVNIVQGVRDL